MEIRFYIQGVNCWLLVYLLRTSQSIQEWTKKNLRKLAFKIFTDVTGSNSSVHFFEHSTP